MKLLMDWGELAAAARSWATLSVTAQRLVVTAGISLARHSGSCSSTLGSVTWK